MSKRALRFNGQPVASGTPSASNEATDGAIDETATRPERITDGDDATFASQLTSVEALQPGLGSGSSGVYVVKREHVQSAVARHGVGAAAVQVEDAHTPDHTEAEAVRRTVMMNPLIEHVTLVVYGWHNVEPGTLSWVFPSVTAAVAAARAMKNAVRWAIVAGRREASDDDLVDARAHGAVLIEQAG